MAITNFEFKARTIDLEGLEARLRSRNPRYVGEDRQIDTYFNIGSGRLKLREGDIENALIYYQRSNEASAKGSKILLYEHPPNPVLKQILVASLGVMAVVDKRRRIYFIENVKFHFDRLEGLGTFVEVEAIDRDGSIGLTRLRAQCEEFASFLGINANDFISESYSDMVLAG